nr:hypothetical protein B0A51_08048 [Rachicladosporium sp. CCFEE 5018]
MPDGEVVAFSAASFVCALFVLEFGADKFIDHTAIVARRTGVSQTIIALLTAGAEWEELAVVVFSIAHHRPSLALGNVVGSAISNILGAFSLGLLFHKDDTAVFDRSSRLYSLLLVAITSLAAVLLSFGRPTAWKAFGGISVCLFVIYVCSIAWAISKGRIAAPELSDSNDSDSEVDDAQGNPPERASVASRQQGDTSVEHLREPLLGNWNAQNTTRPVFARSSREETFSPGSPATELPGSPAQRPSQHSLTYHVGLLLVGFIALLVSAYVLSQAASTLATEFAISDVLFGIIILSIATTIPEKFIAA